MNRAIPGPGEEIESDPDAGVVDSEKVSVVFLVRRCSPSETLVWKELTAVRASIASPTDFCGVLWLSREGRGGRRGGPDHCEGVGDV